MFETVEYEFDEGAVIKVIGVGGGGGNAVNHMVETMNSEEKVVSNNMELPIGGFDADPLGTIDFFVVNTDAQALRKSRVPNTVQIGGNKTKGLGAGANPNVGREAAMSDQDAIRSMLEDTDMVFIAAGMGGGTGTGAAPIVAQIAKEMGILTVAVVTKPFSFEGKKRMHFAELGIQELSKHVDSLITIPNEKLLKVLGKNITLIDAFAKANDILNHSVRGISDMITQPGIINVDFADVRTVMEAKGQCMMGAGIAKGEPGSGRAEQAAQEAIASPLLEDVDLSNAKGVLVNVTSGRDLTLEEFHIVNDFIKEIAADDASVIVGTSLQPELEGEIRVTVVAAGVGEEARETAEVRVQARPAPISQLLGGSAIPAGVQNAAAPNRTFDTFNPDAQQGYGHNQTQQEYQQQRPANELDTPAFMRARKLQDEKELLDVSAFMRNTNHNAE
ncbi:cell division protein FtsZ [Cricetibacter osteomyelitidis]|uniref:Cell division protein FtsZ n=1 Tax=Cricetibacter osteomyelitidis TaxID=1521931 RepID=A0A4V2T1V1_9PAST|nr:cell division protein FtsZ [Cricetibacter osteomyelitidis]TCP95013.1 cell division protein FtsZ [Cricetibacter osteomyelitidis]